MKKEMVRVSDEDGNEIFLAETVGEAREYCQENNITGSNGEYLAYGTFDEDDRYFEFEDYENI